MAQKTKFIKAKCSYIAHVNQSTVLVKSGLVFKPTENLNATFLPLEISAVPRRRENALITTTTTTNTSLSTFHLQRRLKFDLNH